MIDSSTNEKLVVSGDGNDGPYIMVPMTLMTTIGIHQPRGGLCKTWFIRGVPF